MMCKLSDICEFVKGKVAVSNLTKTNYISTENMLPNRGGIVEAATLPSVDTTQTYTIGDILVSNIRPYFKKIWFATTNGGCSNDVLVFRAKKDVNPFYLYYILSDDRFFNYATATSKGTKMPRGDKIAIMNYEIEKHTRSEQDAIASILRPIDEKISLNREINNNLLEQAITLYRECFESDKSLTKGKISDIALNVTDGVHNTVIDDPNGDYFLLSCKNIKGGTLSIGSSERRINKSTFEKLRKRTKLSKGDILISSVGTIGEVFMLNTEPSHYEFQRSVAIVKPNFESVSSPYLYLSLLTKKAELINAAHGAVQQCLFISDIAEFPILIPKKEDMIEFTKLVMPMFDMITENENENMRLSSVRDALLPKLMSGEIDMSDIKF